jgi:hypothetical protein
MVSQVITCGALGWIAANLDQKPIGFVKINPASGGASHGAMIDHNLGWCQTATTCSDKMLYSIQLSPSIDNDFDATNP